MFFYQTDKVDPHHPRISGHKGNVLDIKWNPFNDFCIASASEDTLVCKTHTHTRTDMICNFYNPKIKDKMTCVFWGLNIYQLDSAELSYKDVCLQVKVWEIPFPGLLKNLTVPMKELQGHSRRVSLIEWHPTANNILFSTGYDYQVMPTWIQMMYRVQYCQSLSDDGCTIKPL